MTQAGTHSQNDSTPPNTPRWTLGDRLRKARRHAGLQAIELADQIGVSPNTISNAENDRGPVARRTLVGWAWATGVDIHWLEYGEIRAEEVTEEVGRTSRRAGAGAAPRRADNRRRAADRLLDGRHPHGRRSQLPEKFRPLVTIGASPPAA